MLPVRKFITYAVATFTGAYPKLFQMYLGHIFVQSALEIGKLIISKFVTETGQYFKNKFWTLLFSLNVSTVVKNSANDSTAAYLSLLCTTVLLESPVNHMRRVYC